MKSLGAVTTKEGLNALIFDHGLEFVETRTSKLDGHVEAVFVSYNPKTASGKFHHYVSVEVPRAVFEECLDL